MRMYDFTLAPSPRRVRMFLAEKGIEVLLVQVDIMKNANRTPEFYKKNPSGSLPILELDDGSCIAESVAICRYFEELQPTPPLFGVGARERALVEMWNRRIELEIFVPVAHVWSHLSEIAKGRGRRIAEFGEIQKRAAINRIAWLNGDLEGREFIAGDEFSIADITALCMIDFVRTVDIRIQPDQPNLARWYRAVLSRQSAKA
jgi:glutathione S-transferase